MARSIRAPKIENRTSRLKLPVRGKPYFVTVAPGISLGYRRNQTVGVWVVRAADGHGGNWIKVIAVADDHEDSNGGQILTYWEAQDRARQLARGREDNGRPASVTEALDAYDSNLRARGAALGNVTRVRANLPASLAAKSVALLGARELRLWRDGMVKHGLAPATADRVARMLKAALNLAASDDPRIGNAAAWRTGLSRLPDAENVRNVILSDHQVRAVVAAAYAIGPAFGLLIEVAAITGQRASQLFALTVADLQNGATPRLMIPCSKKGRNRRVERKALPIPHALAAKLQAASAARPGDAPLLVDDQGKPWRMISLILFRRAAAAAGLEPSVTPYALRHSSIVRMLVAGTPIRIVAGCHDTSTVMIERTYSRHIVGDPSDSLVRRGQLDLATAPSDNVVPIGGRS